MMASAQVVEMSVSTNNNPSQNYTTNPDDHSNHNIDSPGFKPFTVIITYSNLENKSHWRNTKDVLFSENLNDQTHLEF